MKKTLELYYDQRASSYSDLDKPETIVSCVRAIGIKDHMAVMRPKPDDQILDVGCGTGRFLKPFSVANVVGFDLSFNMLRKAKNIAPLVRGDAEHLPFKDESFDVAHSAGLTGVLRSRKILEEMARVVRSNKYVYVSFPAASSISGAIARSILRLSRGKYNPSLMDYWYTKKDICVMFPPSMEIEEMIRLGWEPPFQRLFKGLRSKKLSRLFVFMERHLRDKPLLSLFGARFLVKARKTD